MSEPVKIRAITATGLRKLPVSGTAISILAITLAALILQSNALAKRNGTLIPFADSAVATDAPCVSCHGDFPINQGGSVTINGLPSRFAPGQTYDLSLSVTGGPGIAIGTQILAVHQDGSASGTLIPVSPNLSSHTYSQRPVPLLTHSSPLSTRTINFRWVAPGNPKGKVEFRFAANSTNNNFSTSGDQVLFGTAETEPQETVDDSPSLFFAQIVNGEAGGARNQSRIILRNTSASPLTGRIRFRDPDGNLLPLPIDSLLQDTIDLTIPGWGSRELKTAGTGPLRIGSAEVTVDPGRDSDIEGTLIFSLLGNFVSINGDSADLTHQLYVTMNAEERTGIAAFNPDLSSSANLELLLLDSDGLELASRTFVLSPGRQVARFLDEQDLFADYFAVNTLPFAGSLHVRVLTGEDVALTGLIQRRAGGELIAVEPSSKAFVPAP